MPSESNCCREINELHRFFQNWFNGVLDNSDECFRRLSEVLADGFEIISPPGTRTHREELLNSLRDTHAMHAASPIEISIQNCGARALSDQIYLATYEEWQATASDKKGRLSSAIMRTARDTPHGVEWLQVHETWLPV